MNNQRKESSLGELFGGTLDVMRGREDGLRRLDLSPFGFSTSFYGLLLMVLIDMSVLMLIHQTRISKLSEQPEQLASAPGLLYFTFGMIAVQLLAYAASILVVYLLTKPEEKPGITTLILVSNWAAPIISLVVSPLVVISIMSMSGGESSGLALFDFLGIAVFAALIIIGVRIIRISLKTDVMRAFFLYAVSALVAFILAEGFERLLGLSLTL